MAEGLQHDEIGQRLFISPKTVATHVEHILRKLGARGRAQAIAIAYHHRILTPGPTPAVLERGATETRESPAWRRTRRSSVSSHVSQVPGHRAPAGGRGRRPAGRRPPVPRGPSPRVVADRADRRPVHRSRPGALARPAEDVRRHRQAGGRRANAGALAGGDNDSMTRRLATIQTLLTSRDVLTRAADQLPGETADTLEDKVSASVDDRASIVDVQASDGDADGAADHREPRGGHVPGGAARQRAPALRRRAARPPGRPRPPPGHLRRRGGDRRHPAAAQRAERRRAGRRGRAGDRRGRPAARRGELPAAGPEHPVRVLRVDLPRDPRRARPRGAGAAPQRAARAQPADRSRAARRPARAAVAPAAAPGGRGVPDARRGRPSPAAGHPARHPRDERAPRGGALDRRGRPCAGALGRRCRRRCSSRPTCAGRDCTSGWASRRRPGSPRS